MVLCTHKGCGQEYDPENNGPGSCTYHPGAPVFHEGLKSWSCCRDVNKPVLDFDEFMKIAVGSATSSRACKTKKLNRLSDRDARRASIPMKLPKLRLPNQHHR